jgi:hypothetical protein
MQEYNFLIRIKKTLVLLISDIYFSDKLCFARAEQTKNQIISYMNKKTRKKQCIVSQISFDSVYHEMFENAAIEKAQLCQA